jgi:hypothetical protein
MMMSRMTFIKVWGALALATVWVSAVYAHQYGDQYGAAATSTATTPVTQDEAAVIARMQGRMADILREKDGARRAQLMEMQMRDMDSLDGGACRMDGMGGKAMHGMPAMASHGVTMAGAHESCPMHGAAKGTMGHEACTTCPKHDAVEGVDKRNNR